MSMVPLGPNLRLPSLQLVGAFTNSNMPSKLAVSGSSNVVMLCAIKCTSTSRPVEVYSMGKCDWLEELHKQPRCRSMESGYGRSKICQVETELAKELGKVQLLFSPLRAHWYRHSRRNDWHPHPGVSNMVDSRWLPCVAWCARVLHAAPQSDRRTSNSLCRRVQRERCCAHCERLQDPCDPSSCSRTFYCSPIRRHLEVVRPGGDQWTRTSAWSQGVCREGNELSYCSYLTVVCSSVYTDGIFLYIKDMPYQYRTI